MIYLHNFTGTYERQEFYKEVPHRIFDHRALTGVRGYLDEEAREALSETIRKEGCLSALHYLDSGNYHHLSFVYLCQIEEDFDLFVFDHHTDMQASAFHGILSCGSWIAEAFERLAHLKNIVMVGVKKESISECSYRKRDNVFFCDSVSEIPDAITLSEKAYLSIDKDVLSVSEFQCDWDQGEMSLSNLLRELRILKGRTVFLGVDVCGEADPSDKASERKSDKINHELLRILKDSFL